jgi:CTP:molybdopterin cytidylyltransferase MocA
MRVPEGVVLLAAGSGSRLAPLTDNCHKSLLPLAGIPALKRTLDEILAAGVEDVVVVTGYRHADIENFLSANYHGIVRCVFNKYYKIDVNILSAELGVMALRHPDHGYMIVETDVIVESKGWEILLDIGDATRSFWATSGKYSESLTGGTLQADSQGNVTSLVYRPLYDSRYKGWLKLLGILYVGRPQVAMDCLTRRRAIMNSIEQYYMMPWTKNLSSLPCFARDLGTHFAASYNDFGSYQYADAEFQRISELRERF